jgi:hypothetical protein
MLNLIVILIPGINISISNAQYLSITFWFQRYHTEQCNAEATVGVHKLPSRGQLDVAIELSIQLDSRDFTGRIHGYALPRHYGAYQLKA